MTENEKFSEQFLRSLTDFPVLEKDRLKNGEVNFFKLAAPIESNFYLNVHACLFEIKGSLFFHSDAEFKKIKGEKFLGIGSWLVSIRDAFYENLDNVKYAKPSHEFSHYFVLHSIDNWSSEENQTLDLKKNNLKLEISFKKLVGEFNRIGFGQDVCDGVETALLQIYEMLIIFDNNYAEFLDCNDTKILRKNFRELNYAVSCLVGLTSRWYPVLRYVNLDKRFLTSFEY
jgi:hypothetical protein